MTLSPTPSQRRGSPSWAAWCSRVHPLISESSSPMKQQSGPRWSRHPALSRIERRRLKVKPAFGAGGDEGRFTPETGIVDRHGLPWRQSAGAAGPPQKAAATAGGRHLSNGPIASRLGVGVAPTSWGLVGGRRSGPCSLGKSKQPYNNLQRVHVKAALTINDSELTLPCVSPGRADRRIKCRACVVRRHDVARDRVTRVCQNG
jgi:hypothetical protein